MNINVADIMDILTRWSIETDINIRCSGIFLFGSLIYRGGSQFGNSSDIDIVAVPPDDIRTAYQRAKWIDSLRVRKILLEQSLTIFLKRPRTSPICSFVVPTRADLAFDLHKDGARKFFQMNAFRNLLTGETKVGIADSGVRSIDEPLAENCLRFAQKKRNQYLNVAADGTSTLGDYDGDDPIPKDIMRHSAMLAELTKPGSEPGSQFDTQYGLDNITDAFFEKKDRDSYFKDIHDRLSIRRNARGIRRPITGFDQLYCSEWIYDSVIHFFAKKAEAESAKRPPKRAPTTAFFSDRFSQAFPGLEDITWFRSAADIRERLSILLKDPIAFSEGPSIWWWRGGCLGIKKFEFLDGGLALMDHEELSISKIAAVPSDRYQYRYLYVETTGMEPTLAFRKSKIDITSSIARSGYSSEEYGLVDGSQIVSRREADDGAATIDGRVQDIRGRCQIRTRYHSPYNFILAGQMSPINNKRFDQILSKSMNAILNDETKLYNLAQEIDKLPLHDHDY